MQLKQNLENWRRRMMFDVPGGSLICAIPKVGSTYWTQHLTQERAGMT